MSGRIKWVLLNIILCMSLVICINGVHAVTMQDMIAKYSTPETIKLSETIEKKTSAISAPPSSLKDYSVDAGDWHVTFKSSIPITTHVTWLKNNGYKNNGFYFIWMNTSYQVSDLTILELPYGKRSPISKEILENILRSKLLNSLSGSTIIDYVIDYNKGLVWKGWHSELNLPIIAAIYPQDISSDNTATTLILYLSSIGEKPSMEIIDSLHIEPITLQLPASNPSQPLTSSGDNSWAARGSGTMGRPASTSPSYTVPSSQSAPPQSTYNIADNSGCPIIGNSNTKKYHEPGCSKVPEINPAHRVCFSSRAEAEAAGYVHCRKC